MMRPLHTTPFNSPHPIPPIHSTPPAPAAQFRLGDAGPGEKLGVCYDPRHNAAYPRNPRQAFAEVRGGGWRDGWMDG